MGVGCRLDRVSGFYWWLSRDDGLAVRVGGDDVLHRRRTADPEHTHQMDRVGGDFRLVQDPVLPELGHGGPDRLSMLARVSGDIGSMSPAVCCVTNRCGLHILAIGCAGTGAIGRAARR